MEDSGKIFDGITVIDLTTFVTGGFCSLMLANQGAEVIKIERPDVGDDSRHSGPPFINDESPYFWTVNYGKKSVELDLTTDAGKTALYDLVDEADVFLQNYRPGTADKLDVDYDTIQQHNETVIYCAISAFGQTGPWSQRPGYDLLVQGLSGIMSITGEEDGQPVKVGLPQTDLITAMWAAFGIVNALYKRSHTGNGEYIDLGMLDATLPWLTKQAGKVFANEKPQQMGTKDPVLAPYQAYQTEDGYLTIACGNQKLWRELCDALDRSELLDDERFLTNADRVEHMDELETELEATLTTRPADEWLTILTEQAGLPAGAVQTVEQALDNEQTTARDMVSEMEHPVYGNVPVIEHPLNYTTAESGFESPPPQLGQHTAEVFKDIGYTEDQLENLRQSGAFGE